MVDLLGEWVEQAACRRSHDPDYWFEYVADSAETVVALNTCHSCPVRRQCLSYAMDNLMELGVWGGTTWRQRIAMARQVASGALPGTREQQYEVLYQALLAQGPPSVVRSGVRRTRNG